MEADEQPCERSTRKAGHRQAAWHPLNTFNQPPCAPGARQGSAQPRQQRQQAPLLQACPTLVPPLAQPPRLQASQGPQLQRAPRRCCHQRSGPPGSGRWRPPAQQWAAQRGRWARPHGERLPPPQRRRGQQGRRQPQQRAPPRQWGPARRAWRQGGAPGKARGRAAPAGTAAAT